jgi:PPOX class probable F420-dependent enzyme
MEFSPTQRTLLGRPVTAVLTTIGADGSPHSAPTWFLFEDDVVVVTTSNISNKVRNLGRKTQVSFTVFDPDNTLSYLEIRGVAEMAPDTDHVALDRIAQLYGYPNGSGFVAPGTTRVKITIKPTRVVTYGAYGKRLRRAAFSATRRRHHQRTTPQPRSRPALFQIISRCRSRTDPAQARSHSANRRDSTGYLSRCTCT